MANVVSANTAYVDTAADVTSYKIKVTQIILTPTAANAILVLSDTVSTNKKLDLRAATSGQSLIVDLNATPMLFEGGLKVATLTNAIVTLMYNRV